MQIFLKRKILRPVAAVLLLLVLMVSVYGVFRWIENRLSPDLSVENDRNAVRQISYNGETYLPKIGVSSYLLLGIDVSGPVQDSGFYRNSYQSDLIIVLVVNNNTKTYTLLQLNRDTMAEIPVLGINDKEAGTITAQLALAHTYGHGLEDSCENTVKAVSAFLSGIRLQNYISLNMDSVGILNDMVGGVTLEVLYDIGSLTKGETVTLHGADALTYVRARSELEDPSNLARMERQRQYMAAFINTLATRLSEDSSNISDSFILNLYNSISDYMVTDLSVSDFSRLLKTLSNYSLDRIVTPSGEAVQGSEFIEFYADPDALLDLVVDLFFQKSTNIP